MIITSRPAARSITAACMSAALRTFTTSAPCGGVRWVGPVTSVTAAPRRSASAATAYPMRPLERLPTKRTGSMSSNVGPAVIKTLRPARPPSPEASRAVCRRAEHLLGGDHHVCRFRQTALADPPAREIAGTGIDHLHAARAQRLEVLHHGRMLEHVGVHRRREQHRRPRGGVERRQEIIREAVGELGDGVRGGRRHHEQVDVRRDRDVLDVGIRAGLPLIGDHLPARDGFEGQRPDELPGRLRHHRHHVVAVLLKPARDLDGLVGPDPAAHAQCNQRHRMS